MHLQQEIDENMFETLFQWKNIDFWTDLHVAVINGSEYKYKVFFDIAVEVIGEIYGADLYRYACKNYLAPDNAKWDSVWNSIQTTPSDLYVFFIWI